MIPSDRIEQAIYFIRGKKIMLDSDLAKLYGIETKALVRAMKRNIERFPEDFMFKLTKVEFENLKSQFVISGFEQKEANSLRCQIGTSKGRGGRRTLPYAFGELGVAMLSSVLHSSNAISINIQIMRAFVHFRKVLSSQKELAKIVTELRSFMLKYSTKNDREIRKIWEVIEKFTSLEDEKSSQKIGFNLDQHYD